MLPMLRIRLNVYFLLFALLTMGPRLRGDDASDAERSFTLKGDWWSQAGSNRRPPACKAGALPSELWPHV